ncbi:MAG: hypothetical protein ACRD6B_15880 [Bryobacteraceae bacterium]
MDFNPNDRKAITTYLLADGNLSVPCSRYGHTTAECAPVAAAVAQAVAYEMGDTQITGEFLDRMMALVVNNLDDPAIFILDGFSPAAARRILGTTSRRALGLVREGR